MRDTFRDDKEQLNSGARLLLPSSSRHNVLLVSILRKPSATGFEAVIRVKVVRTPTVAVVDGIYLHRFVPGHQYDVGDSVGALLLAEGWAEPIRTDEPALVIPLNEMMSEAAVPMPPNLIRERSDRGTIESAADRRRGDRRRRK